MTPFFSASIVDFQQVNFSWEGFLNPTKFQSMIIEESKTINEVCKFNFGSKTIETSNSVKLLRVTINNKLKFICQIHVKGVNPIKCNKLF